MRSYPTDLTDAMAGCCLIVAVLLAAMLWIEHLIDKHKERERRKADEAYARWRAEQEVEWQRWLREGRG